MMGNRCRGMCKITDAPDFNIGQHVESEILNLAARNNGQGLCSGTAEAMLKQSLPSAFNENSPGRKLKRRKLDEAGAEADKDLEEEAPRTPRTTPRTNSEAGISPASGLDNFNLEMNADIDNEITEVFAIAGAEEADDVAGGGDGRPEDEDLGMPTA